ncbi:hypothetical protein, partial [Nocardiopsis sp. FR26]|uniref:hypothetical protein n=1 Tax=Nocardiopsis sp. FR26 TaxID=2605987 RepID=UPI001F3DAD0A
MTYSRKETRVQLWHGVPAFRRRRGAESAPGPLVAQVEAALVGAGLAGGGGVDTRTGLVQAHPGRDTEAA